MKNLKLEDMFRGWFVGDFQPTAFNTDACEVAIKQYKKGDYESAHYHKIATEITVILSGEVKMNAQHWKSGDILVIEPGEKTDFQALADTVTIVVKVPGAKQDKYICQPIEFQSADD